jgi:hypothetical protein
MAFSGCGSTDGYDCDALCHEHAHARAPFHHAHEGGSVYHLYDSTLSFTSGFISQYEFNQKAIKALLLSIIAICV